MTAVTAAPAATKQVSTNGQNRIGNESSSSGGGGSGSGSNRSSPRRILIRIRIWRPNSNSCLRSNTLDRIGPPPRNSTSKCRTCRRSQMDLYLIVCRCSFLYCHLNDKHQQTGSARRGSDSVRSAVLESCCIRFGSVPFRSVQFHSARLRSVPLPAAWPTTTTKSPAGERMEMQSIAPNTISTQRTRIRLARPHFVPKQSTNSLK